MKGNMKFGDFQQIAILGIIIIVLLIITIVLLITYNNIKSDKQTKIEGIILPNYIDVNKVKKSDKIQGVYYVEDGEPMDNNY